MVVDIVTDRSGTMHDELADAMGHGAAYPLPGEGDLCAVSYRPARREDRNEIDIWASRFTLGGVLGSLPLALRRGPSVPVDLEATYIETCQRLRIPPP